MVMWSSTPATMPRLRKAGVRPMGLTPDSGIVPVMVSAPGTDQEELVSRLMELFARTLDHQGTCLETLELTYAQAKLIWRLAAGGTPPPQGAGPPGGGGPPP